MFHEQIIPSPSLVSVFTVHLDREQHDWWHYSLLPLADRGRRLCDYNRGSIEIMFGTTSSSTVGNSCVGARRCSGGVSLSRPFSTPSPLIGVSRIGPLAKSLLIKSDRQFQLVIICTQWPTMNLFEQISTMLLDHFPVCLMHSIDRQTSDACRSCRRAGIFDWRFTLTKRRRRSKWKVQPTKGWWPFPSKWLPCRSHSTNRRSRSHPNNCWVEPIASGRSTLSNQFDGFKCVVFPSVLSDQIFQSCFRTTLAPDSMHQR